MDRHHRREVLKATAATGLAALLPSASLAQFVRTHHPRELKKLEQEHRAFDWQQIQSLVWLGEDISSFRDLVKSWKTPFAYPKQYEQHGWPVFQQEVAAILCRPLVG